MTHAERVALQIKQLEITILRLLREGTPITLTVELLKELDAELSRLSEKRTAL